MKADERSSDPVIDAYKKDIDVTLLEESLKKTPEERVLAIMEMQRLIEEMRRGNPALKGQ
ncbi:MAG TPA: hypothetical protein VKQ32_05490 [Polyangia bacterium]|nr:hypothetical protein [Polyangia bacterium]